MHYNIPRDRDQFSFSRRDYQGLLTKFDADSVIIIIMMRVQQVCTLLYTRLVNLHTQEKSAT